MHELFYMLSFGIPDDQLASLLKVHRSTIKRWKAGTCRIPYAVIELLKLTRRRTLPVTFGEFSSFQCDGQRIWPADYHYTDGISARDIRNWYLIRHILLKNGYLL